MLQDYWQDIGLDLYKTGCASKCRCKAATHAQDIKGSSVISAMHHSLVLDKAHLVFSPCQTVCPYTHVVFLGFVYWIDSILGNGQCLFTTNDRNITQICINLSFNMIKPKEIVIKVLDAEFHLVTIKNNSVQNAM